MDPQLKMLLWKEWRERRGQLALCLACVLAPAAWMTFWSLRYAVWKDRGLPLGLGGAWLVLYGMLMPIFVAMRTSRGETTDRTAAFSLGLPVSPCWANWIRLGGGAAVLAAPVLLLGILGPLVFAAVWYVDPKIARELVFDSKAFDWSALGWFELALLVGVVAAMGCYVQLTLLGTLVRSENQLAFLGAVWTIVWFLAACATLDEFPKAEWLQWFSPHALMLSPLSNRAHEGPDQDRLLRAAFTNLILGLAIAAWFADRQGRLLARGPAAAPWWVARLSRARAGWAATIGKALPASWLSSLAWLALRQALPMCMAGLAIALALCGVLASLEHHDRPYWTEASRILPEAVGAIGILWASIVGVGSVADELDRGTGDFWRTRPIPFWRLFAVKFLVGLVAVIVVLDGPALLVGRIDPTRLAFRAGIGPTWPAWCRSTRPCSPSPWPGLAGCGGSRLERWPPSSATPSCFWPANRFRCFSVLTPSISTNNCRSPARFKGAST